MSRLTRAEINIASLKHNFHLLKTWTGAGFFCPMVKSNAYGHDDVLVSLVAESEGASAVGVARVEEGIHLRQNGVEIPILAFVPLLQESARAALDYGITPVLGRIEDLEILLELSKKAPCKVHLEFNTGMQRLGFDEDDVPTLMQMLRGNPQIEVEGVCTHFVYGEEAHQPGSASQKQIEKFNTMTTPFPGVRHVHKSASLIAQSANKTRDEFGARPGISLYGLPHEGRQIGPGLKPVLRWVSELATLHRVEQGETVSYGGRWRAAKKSWIGVVPVGYGDGYMRCLSNKGEMLFRGLRVPVVGSVCMDYTLIDLTDACRDGEPKHGEEIVILGSQSGETISAAEIADRAGTIAYEIVTGIRLRVPREAV